VSVRQPGEPTVYDAARSRLTEIVDRLAKAADVLLAPEGWKALVGRPPRSVSSFRLVHGLHARGVHPATIIDVGANRGQFSNAAMRRWPDAQIIAFEPVGEVASELEALGAYGSFEAHRLVIGASDGTVDFHVHDYTLSSSVLRSLGPAQPNDDSLTTPVRSVRQRRLDSVLGSERLARPVLLKLDVQGYELEVLKGAEELLGVVDFMAIELSVVAAYHGQPLFAAMNRELEKRGFGLDAFLDVRREKGLIVETDALYRSHRRI
jgi:FkbM family methyltransferase